MKRTYILTIPKDVLAADLFIAEIFMKHNGKEIEVDDKYPLEKTSGSIQFDRIPKTWFKLKDL
jgi:hypothetical protein